MNIQKPPASGQTAKKTAQQALEDLRAAIADATPTEVAAIRDGLTGLLPVSQGANNPPLNRKYPQEFKPDAAYKATMPDLQNSPEHMIRGEKRTIQHVGISNFRMPIRFHTRDDGDVTLETSVTGTVSLEAGKKGINMSRIMRSFYTHADRSFSFKVISDALDDYKRDLESLDARILMRFSFPAMRKSLRSGLQGYQYYDIALEVVEQDGARKKIIHLDYVYSSTCPCSLELSEHAREFRGQLATPHSQRSVARISVVMNQVAGHPLWFEDLIDLCRQAVPTETQVMVKREDEQAFAELNAANPIFVEDATRLFCQVLRADPRIGDFKVVASHQESLHSHDAVSVLTEGDTFDSQSIDPHLFATLIHRG